MYGRVVKFWFTRESGGSNMTEYIRVGGCSKTGHGGRMRHEGIGKGGW